MKYSRENKEKGGSKGGLHGGSLAVECSIVWILLIGKVFFSLGSVLEDGKLVQIWMLVVVFFSNTGEYMVGPMAGCRERCSSWRRKV